MLPPLASSNSSRIGLFYSIGIKSPFCIQDTQVILILVVEGFSHLLTPIPIRVCKPYCLTTTLNKPCSNVGWTMGYSITPTISPSSPLLRGIFNLTHQLESMPAELA